MKKKKQRDCRAPGNRGRMRKWLGRHQEIHIYIYIKMARLGRGEKDGRKRVEAGARGRNGGAGKHYRVGCGGRHFRGPLMAKATTGKEKPKVTEVQVEIRKPEEESNSCRLRRDARLR